MTLYLAEAFGFVIVLQLIGPGRSLPALDLDAVKAGSFDLPLHRRYSADGKVTENDYDYLAAIFW